MGMRVASCAVRFFDEISTNGAGILGQMLVTVDFGGAKGCIGPTV
jgi:hypothetical protein